MTELVFVWGAHALPGVSSGEWVGYYRPPLGRQFAVELGEYLRFQMDLFADSIYEDYFSQAPYRSLDEELTEAEWAAFRSGLGAADRDTPFESLCGRRLLRGYDAVVHHRIATGDWEKVQEGVHLFGELLGVALDGVDWENPYSEVEVSGVKEFGPMFVERLLRNVAGCEDFRTGAFERFVGRSFEGWRPALEQLQRAVGSEGWPCDDLSLGRLLFVVDHFNDVAARWECAG